MALIEVDLVYEVDFVDFIDFIDLVDFIDFIDIPSANRQCIDLYNTNRKNKKILV